MQPYPPLKPPKVIPLARPNSRMQTGSDLRPFSPLNSPNNNNHDTDNPTNFNGEIISKDVVASSEDIKSEDDVLQSPIIRPVSQLQQRFTHYTYEIDLHTSYLHMCIYTIFIIPNTYIHTRAYQGD